MTTYFDCLPVELLHMIFEFMSNNDVIWSFFNISPYLNAILNNYYFNKLNFPSISKCHFDFICNHLDSNKIDSLILSNDETTPGQVQLFFNRFYLQDFINLHSLTLLSISNDDMRPILSDLPKLKYLNSLITTCRSTRPLFIGQILNQLKSLEALSISHGDIFDHNVSFPLHNLKILNAGNCNFLELRRLQMIVPSLISLEIILQANHQLQLLSSSDIWASLERLNLTLNGESIITFNEIQQFLIHFQKLKYLTLNIRGVADHLADGKRWETCPTIINLEKFNFIIQFKDPFTSPNQTISQLFDSFCTSFWIDYKKWYIAITTHYVYTISCFDNQLFHSPMSMPLSSAPDNHWFYSKTKGIKIETYPSLIYLNRFNNLEKLDLSEENILLSINNIHQFAHLRHLIFHQSISSRILGNILKQSPHINHLTLTQNDFNRLYPLENIQYLHFHESIKLTNRIQVKQLSRVFPSIKRLSIQLNSLRLICQLIDHFHHLENGIFDCHEIIEPLSQEWLTANTRFRNHKYSFTFRAEPHRLLLWINNSTVPDVHLKVRISENLNSIQTQRSDKCLVQ